MSRSYKHSPVAKMRNSGWAKRQASRASRRNQDEPNGRAYRKDYHPWEICDWRGRPESLREYARDMGDDSGPPSRKTKRKYKKYYRMK